MSKIATKKKIPEVIVEVTRKIKEETRLLLSVQAGGRCEFFECNDYLFSDKITHKNIKWGEFAHIYAFSDDGPRGKAKDAPKNKNGIENLMLLCPACHTKIDKGGNVPFYTAEILKKQKKDHENRVRHVTSLKEDSKTKVLCMSVNIEDEAVCVSQGEIVEALLAESYYHPQEASRIDFLNVPSSNTSLYWRSKREEIDVMVKEFYEQFKRDGFKHVSVFAIGPMPLLVYLGSKLENKVKTLFFQLHRETESWKWNKDTENVSYKVNIVKGRDKNKVAVLLSLSGKIQASQLPKSITDDFYVYEITLANSEPNFHFLKNKKDLDGFAVIYSKLLSQIRNVHSGLKEIHLFPAVPAPVAIVCGRSLNRKADTRMRVYNARKDSSFKYALKIN